jgi:hypothetical protein
MFVLISGIALYTRGTVVRLQHSGLSARSARRTLSEGERGWGDRDHPVRLGRTGSLPSERGPRVVL